MERLAGPDEGVRTELARLNAELEQALVAVEDAQKEVTLLARQRDALAATDAELRAARAKSEASRQTAEEVATTLREQLAVALSTLAGRQANEMAESARDEELGVALEEAQTLAEELQVANDALLTSNQELDQRVADRTGALDKANAALELINAELQRRVEIEAAAREEAQSRLFQAQKLEAIGQLTGGIAHDFNNLLTVITGSTQFLRHTDNPERRGHLLRRIEEAAWRGADLTRRLLAFGRRQPLHPDRVDLGVQASGLTELLRHTLREDISIHMQFDPDLWPVEADVGALELALLNIAVNARDAMPDGGQIVLAAHNMTMQAGQPTRLGLAPGDYVEISVSDAGIGMPPEVLERVFEPFFTTKQAGKGTGLGLAQVYGFAKQSGGTAWVESRQGEGTCVHIQLPRSWREPAAESVPLTASEVRAAAHEGALSILVVEDDEAVAAVVLEMLGQLGHHTLHVVSVAAALGVLSGDRQVDLVFTDVLLPGGGSGLDLAREIARQALGIPVVLTSGYGGGVTGRLAAANLPFLRKPYRIEALKLAIDEALRQGAPHNQPAVR
ncbi:MAG TPA: ATP-binding protein [Acetobacteraceae bacterium]|jgi:signal transduction histidine kinase|nr:ATP-binding protein [Acetobacteraceae bacterium]